MKNKLFLFALGILFISIVSANGLIITEDNLDINKTYEVDQTFNVNITNTEPFKFFDIGIEEEFAEVDLFDLESGESKIVTVTYTGNTDYQGDLTFRGDFATNLGASNETYIINIDYENGFDRCNLDLVIGDSITWVNQVNDYIKLVDSTNDQDFLTINEGENHTKQFNYVEEINYYARIIAKFTQTCKINIQDDDGFAHSFEYDDKVNINLKILYPETTLTANFLKSDYTIEYNDFEEDIFSIQNTGNKEAKDIKFSGEWLIFDENDIDLQTGNSKNIGFKIDPNIFETNQTNKTHIINLTITGNFPTITKELNIFIPHKEVENPFIDGTWDDEVIVNFIKFWCNSNSDHPICVFLDNENGTSLNGGVEVIYTAQTIKELLERERNYKQIIEDFLQASEETNIIRLNEDKNQTAEISRLADEQKESNEASNKAVETILFSVGLVLFVVLMYFLITKVPKKEKEMIKTKAGYHRGELEW